MRDELPPGRGERRHVLRVRVRRLARGSARRRARRGVGSLQARLRLRHPLRVGLLRPRRVPLTCPRGPAAPATFWPAPRCHARADRVGEDCPRARWPRPGLLGAPGSAARPRATAALLRRRTAGFPATPCLSACWAAFAELVRFWIASLSCCSASFTDRAACARCSDVDLEFASTARLVLLRPAAGSAGPAARSAPRPPTRS